MKKVLSLLGLLIALCSPAFGAAGIYDPFAIVNGNFYDLGANTSNPDFQGASLGTFDPSTQQLLLGGQEKSYKNNGTDVFGHTLEFSIYTGVRTGSFTAINYSFQFNYGDNGAPGDLNTPGDQQWGTDITGANTTNGAVNILAGLLPGVYTLELYSYVTTNGVDSSQYIYNNNGNNVSNYTATFVVVPEPSSLALIAGPALLGAWLFVRRRRA